MLVARSKADLEETKRQVAEVCRALSMTVRVYFFFFLEFDTIVLVGWVRRIQL